MADSNSSRPVLERVGVRRVINAAGIYTDLGGACLSPTIWESIAEVNDSFVSLRHLLDRTGELIADAVGVEAARVVPGASAGVALSAAACIARGNGTVSERLPKADGVPHEVLLQANHQYNYARCAELAGATVRHVGGASGTCAEELRDAITPQTAAVLVPAHLDGKKGTIPLETLTEITSARDVPLIVDAAYLSYPTALIRSHMDAGADLACFSAKYFYGPNAGGFILGNKSAIANVKAVDFTEYEAGPFLNFGRGFKMDRTAVLATWLALEEWLALDHDARWAEYATRVDALSQALCDLPNISATPCQFTLEETIIDSPVNALALRSMPGGPGINPVVAALENGDPWVFCSRVDDALLVCVETVAPSDDELLAERLRSAWEA